MTRVQRWRRHWWRRSSLWIQRWGVSSHGRGRRQRLHRHSRSASSSSSLAASDVGILVGSEKDCLTMCCLPDSPSAIDMLAAILTQPENGELQMIREEWLPEGDYNQKNSEFYVDQIHMMPWKATSRKKIKPQMIAYASGGSFNYSLSCGMNSMRGSTGICQRFVRVLTSNGVFGVMRGFGPACRRKEHKKAGAPIQA